MSRSKKSRRVTDILPMRKSDNAPVQKTAKSELNAQAKSDKKDRKHKGLNSGNRQNPQANKPAQTVKQPTDHRIGSKKKIDLFATDIELTKTNLPAAKPVELVTPVNSISLEQELFNIENDKYFHELLDQIEDGKKVSKDEQIFVNQQLARLEELMLMLNINLDDDEKENDPESDLYDMFNKIDLNQFK